MREFEEAMAEFCGTRYGVAVNSGTAALHSAVRSIKLSKNDEVIVPAISFVATANSVLYEGARPVFCDVEEDTLLIDPSLVEQIITPRTKALIAVDYAGQLADYKVLNALCKNNDLVLIADGCHSLGSEVEGIKSGALADLTIFSFHPVKQITTGEGGMVMTDSEDLCNSIRTFRNHMMSSTPTERQQEISHSYDVTNLGFNYRLTDIQAALGKSQLTKLPSMTEKRRKIAATYDSAFSSHPDITPLRVKASEQHAYHLYVVKVPERDKVFQAMRQRNIGVNVHYKPIYLHTLYRERYGTEKGLCPAAEKAHESILSLPLFPQLSSSDQQRVIDTLFDIIAKL